MKEIDLLLEKALKYLKSAEILLQAEDYESSVSRVYYSMFYAAEAALLVLSLSFSSHKAVISAFGKHFVKSGIFPSHMSKDLSKAFEKRQVGDYGFTQVLAESDARELLGLARKFVETIYEYLKSEGATQ
jgi:uncharacterized protein (UPF0332 family)